jgi:flagellar basal body-associated protein FliL
MPGGNLQRTPLTLAYINSDVYVKALIALRHIRMSRQEFCTLLFEMIVEDDDRLMDLLAEKRRAKLPPSKHEKRMIKREREIKEEITDRFQLDGREVEDIFDILEKEEGDLFNDDIYRELEEQQ